MRQLKPYVELEDYNAETIKNKLLALKEKDYCRFKIVHFKKLMSYEKQVKENFIVVEREGEDVFAVHDNTHFREKHELPFSDANNIAEYVSQLLTEKTLLGYSQHRAATEKGLQFGDTVEIEKSDGKKQKGVLVSAYDLYSPNERDNSEFMLHYQPLKKDGTLSKATPRRMYQYKCRKVEEKLFR